MSEFYLHIFRKFNNDYIYYQILVKFSSLMKVVHCNDNIVKFKSEQILLILECILSFEHQPPKQKTKNKNKTKQKKKNCCLCGFDLRYLDKSKQFTCITGIRHDVCTCRNRLFFADKENLVRKVIVANSSDYTAQCSLHAITCDVSTNPKCSRI